MDSENIAVKLAEHQKEIGSLKHRMGDAEKLADKINDITISINRLAINMDGTLTELKQQSERLEKLEKEPADDFKWYKRMALSSIVAALLGAIVQYYL